MFKKLTLATVGLFLLTACAGGPPPEPPAPPPLDPTGTFDITVDAEGMTVSGVMIIRGSLEEGYTGSIDTEMGGAGMTDLVIEGQTLTFSIPEAGADALVTFEGDGFIGGMNGMMGEAGIVGVKRTEG
jgi:hypothetical protein